jgi:hypothetical protein
VRIIQGFQAQLQKRVIAMALKAQEQQALRIPWRSASSLEFRSSAISHRGSWPWAWFGFAWRIKGTRRFQNVWCHCAMIAGRVS